MINGIGLNQRAQSFWQRQIGLVLKRSLAELIGRGYSLWRYGVPDAAQLLSLMGEGDLSAFADDSFKIFPGLRVEIQTPRIVRSSFRFYHEDLSHPLLDELRSRYHLDKITNGTKTDFERALILANWLRGRITYGPPSRSGARAFSACEILQRAETGERFWCGSTVIAFIQCLLSLGINARLLNIAYKPQYAHVVSEMWRDEVGKWVLIDVDNNVHYLFEGVPQNALELHNHWHRQTWRDVEIVLGERLSTKEPDISPYNKVHFYNNLAVKMRNNWLSTSYLPWHPMGNCVFSDLEWVDEFTKGRLDRAVWTNKIEDLYWTIHWTKAAIEDISWREDKAILRLFLETDTPGFKSFLVRWDGKSQEVPGPYCSLALDRGIPDMSITSLNLRGREGQGTKLVFEWSL